MTTPIFNPEKAVEATLLVANGIEKKDFHKIFKILYFADRDHLVAYGRVITGDTYIKMGKGPVPSKLYNIMKALREGEDYTYASLYGSKERCSQVFAVENKKFVAPLRKPDMDLLSASDVEMLSAAVGKYGALSFDQLTTISHAYAWRAAADNREIALENMMREGGADEAFIAYITENIIAEKEMCGVWS
jgi:uncharacterized phage-associated protein